MRGLPPRTDVIAAIATPEGRGGVAVMRVSGPDALRVLNGAFLPASGGSEWKWGQMRYGALIAADGTVADRCLAVYFPSPRSYTGENCAEIHLHGGSATCAKALEIATKLGARPAFPGEFTFRAFANGRIDLTQAEAVADLIGAQGDAARRNALALLDGALADKIAEIKRKLVKAAAEIEAHLDFPEEEIEPQTVDIISGWLEDARSAVASLAATYEQGKALRDGRSVVIAGAPNVGKSSALNRLLGYERAITSPQAGTTRDFVAESVFIGGAKVRLTDTAGVRTPDDSVEREGVERAEKLAKEADFVLALLDGSVEPTEKDEAALEITAGKKRAIVFNKSDLPSFSIRNLRNADENEPRFAVSCKTGEGFDDLIKYLEKTVAPQLAFEEGAYVTSARQREALDYAGAYLLESVEILRGGGGLELAADGVRAALFSLAEIVGEVAPEETLGEIFARFCVGK